ncbi:glycosyltransferase family 2 protein [Bacteroides stercorirosoris]|uniref:Glycosyltransferase involved in cell wall bisynthesis n=1 Tax=Bacteroides stercorirosoris TaxID=871324 RepID=A0A1M6GRB9_9BACE|nr:glycosyltransferase family 2 protein [Bacteroides stercorirosoris]SHJ12438.1 Glycosyltransferase involved in cell wall bisynthesis [Bacteroides stercorirosoris]
MDEKVEINKEERPLMVTIRCITYNHEPYIRQCLEGFIMQKTNFRFEAIVHDDASTDETAKIIREYAEKYPDIIKPIFETENQYSKLDGSIQRIMSEHIHGKYVAMCEGDDYWIDPLKLQKQVDFLESNPEYSMCAHNAFVFYQQKNDVCLFNKTSYSGELPVHDAIHAWKIPTASILVLSEVAKEYPSWLAVIYSGDYSLILRTLLKGKIYLISDIMSVYRISYVGYSASALYKGKNIFMLEQRLILLESFLRGTGGMFAMEIESKISSLKEEIVFQECKDNRKILRLLFTPIFYKKLLNKIRRKC